MLMDDGNDDGVVDLQVRVDDEAVAFALTADIDVFADAEAGARLAWISQLTRQWCKLLYGLDLRRLLILHSVPRSRQCV